MAVGQPTFLTQSGDKDILEANDGNYAWEWWYKWQVTDNISVTPALYYLSVPFGQLQKGQGSGTNGDGFDNFGGLVKTTFKF
jgi:carbohydrate-selective porin OprB